MIITDEDLELCLSYQNDWNKFARDVLAVRLDYKQREILSAIQVNRKVSVRSGNARGKDFLTAVAALCFLYLSIPSKVILTAPTGRQVYAIMMAEISHIYRNTSVPLGGRLLENYIKFDEKEWYLIGFKAGDSTTEAWSGFHSENIFVGVTEATGIEDQTFQAIEGILTGNSRLFLAFNPIQKIGESYISTYSKNYKHFVLSSFQAPNVRAKKVLIPGQVDYRWLKERVEKEGWTVQISEEEFDKEQFDFKFEGKYYRPLDPFRIRVLGQYGVESSDVLFPIEWLEASHERWRQNPEFPEGSTRYAIDIAGMGRDMNCFAKRIRNYLKVKVQNIPKNDKIHMQVAGMVKNLIQDGGIAFIDTIGEGAGVFSRLAEQDVDNAYTFKGSYGAKGLTDYSEQYEFLNMRAFCYWALRDALNPQYKFNLAIEPNKELDEELLNVTYEVMSNGKIKIVDKDKIKERIGRSPDRADAATMTFMPIPSFEMKEVGKVP